jgi:diguanylate cyclase
MAEEQALLKQLDSWKDKYYRSINDLEKQREYDELLQRSLGRLALAAQGLDPALDKQLNSLRTILRKKIVLSTRLSMFLKKWNMPLCAWKKMTRTNTQPAKSYLSY